jgi:hypothetical protein
VEVIIIIIILFHMCPVCSLFFVFVCCAVFVIDHLPVVPALYRTIIINIIIIIVSFHVCPVYFPLLFVFVCCAIYVIMHFTVESTPS